MTNQPTIPACGADGTQWKTVGTLAAGASTTFTFMGLQVRTRGSGF